DLRALAPLLRADVLEVDVARLEVAVDDARGVRGDEALEDVVDDRADLAEREALLAFQPVREPLALELREDEQLRAGRGRAHLDELADVRALDRRRDLRLALEALDEIGLHRGAREQHLDRDLARIRLPLRSPHLAHAAAAEEARHAIACKHVARVDRHVTWI